MSLERLVPGTEGWTRYSADHIQRYDYFKPHYKSKAVLDMACGTGYGSNIISLNGATSVLGIDIADEAVQFANSHYKSGKVQFKKLDYKELPATGNTFDLVMSFETIEHVDDPAGFIKTAANVLKPGGKLICSTPNKKKFSDAGIVNEFHVSELYYEDFKMLFSQHFDIVHEYYQTESVQYLRWLRMNQEIDSLKYNYDRLPWGRLKKFAKNIIGKKDPVFTDEAGIQYPHPSDFTLDVMYEYKDHYSVIILEGTKR